MYHALCTEFFTVSTIHAKFNLIKSRRVQSRTKWIWSHFFSQIHSFPLNLFFNFRFRIFFIMAITQTTSICNLKGWQITCVMKLFFIYSRNCYEWVILSHSKRLTQTYVVPMYVWCLVHWIKKIRPNCLSMPLCMRNVF